MELKLADATRRAYAQAVLLTYEELKQDHSTQLCRLDLGHQLARLWALTADQAQAESLLREVIADLKQSDTQCAVARIDRTSAELVRLLNDAGRQDEAHIVQLEASWSGELAVSFHGISVEFLCKFEEDHAEAVNFLSTDAVVERIIKPCSKATKLYDPDPKGQAVIEMAHDQHRGLPTFSLSHAWRQTFSVNAGRPAEYRGGFMQAIQHKIPEAERSSTFVWHDVFCVNQHLRSPHGGLLAFAFEPLWNAMSCCERVLLFMETWDDPAPLGRVWCLDELRTALLLNKPVEVILPAPAIATMRKRAEEEREALLEDIDRVVDRVDINHASATFRADRDYVLQIVESTIGADALNLFCKHIIRDALICASGLPDSADSGDLFAPIFESMLKARQDMKVPQQIEVTRTVAMMKIRTAGTKDRQARLAAGLGLLNEAQGLALKFYGANSQLWRDLQATARSAGA